MEKWDAKLLYEAKLELGEGAAWHSKWQQFLYVDVEKKKIGCIDLFTNRVKEIYVGRKISIGIPAFNDKLLVALQGSLELLDFQTGKLQELTKIERDKPSNRCNDGKCDALGRLWIGTMDADAQPKGGALYRYDGNSLEKMIDRISVSNGLCWSLDNNTMYYIDSLDFNVKAYDFDLSSGTLNNERIVITIKEPGHIPDGMCIDEEGMLWVAMWGGFAVHRYNPYSGELIGVVSVDAPFVTSCAFGGEDLQQLFITTATVGLSSEQLDRYPYSGSLFIVETGIKGVQGNSFSL